MSTQSIAKVDSNTTITSYGDYYVYLVDCSSNNVTVTLPEILYEGMYITFKRIDSSSGNSCTIAPYSGQSISAATSLVPGQSVKFISWLNNTTWYNLYN